MGVYNVYTRSGDALTQVTAGVVADNDKEAVQKSQSAAGTYAAFPAEIPEATLEAWLAQRLWPHDSANWHTLTAAVAGRNGTLTLGSRQITALSATADLRPGMWVSGAPGVRGAQIVSIDSGTAVTVDTDLARDAGEAGVKSLNFAEYVT